MATADSLVVGRRSRLRPILGAAALLALAAGAWWLLPTSGKGQPEDPARVLLVAPDAELVEFLQREGFDAQHLSPGVLVAEGRRFDPSLGALAAMVEFADRNGIGYLALDLAHGQSYDFADFDRAFEGRQPPPGSSFAVLSIGDLGRELSFGGPIPEVAHDRPAGEQVGLLLALFAQTELATARSREASNDLMIRFGSAGTVDDLLAYEQARQSMGRQAQAWRELDERERGETVPLELAAPFERLAGWPLANGALLLAGTRDAWHSVDGLRSSWGRPAGEQATFFVLSDLEGPRIPCDALPDTLDFDGGFVVAPAGDALLIPSDRWTATLWVLAGEGCGFERRGPIRRLQDGALGQPRASGRTAEVVGGRLMWADAKMQAYRQLALPGVSLRERGLRWIDDETLLIPAHLDFAAAEPAEAQTQTPATADAGADGRADASREALLWVRLPPARVDDRVEIAVHDIDALLPGAQAGEHTIVDAFPIGSPSAAVVAIAGPEGTRLLRIARPGDDGWTNALATDYRLTAVAERGRAAIDRAPLPDLPAEIHDLAISPTGRHAAWAAPFGDAATDDPTGSFEIMLLPLPRADGPQASADAPRRLTADAPRRLTADAPRRLTADAPRRLTVNDRSDLLPRFIGDAWLVIDSSYPADDSLPTLEALRALNLR